ncbi:MAG: hypothetical protein R3F08_15040 [Dokdonella sp.]
MATPIAGADTEPEMFVQADQGEVEATVPLEMLISSTPRAAMAARAEVVSA